MAQTPCVFKKAGEVIDYTPGSAATAGDVVVQGTLVGIVLEDIAASTLGALCVRGVFDVPKDSSNLSSIGTAIYWDSNGNPVGGTAGSGAFTSTATSNTFAGWNLEVAGAGVGTVRALILSSNAVSVTTIDDLTDVGTIAHAAGAIIVGDGSKFEEVAISGPMALSSAGVLRDVPATVAVGGTAQANANAVAEGFTVVTGADNSKAIVLPAAVAGAKCYVKNATTTAVLKVFPATGDKINGGTANAVYNMGNAAFRAFVAYDATDWYTDPETIV